MSHLLDLAPEAPRFTETLRVIRQRAERESLSLQQLIEVFGPKGHAFLTLFLVLPFLQPIPLIGLSTVLGLTLAFVGIFMLLDRPPWIPHRLARVMIDASILLRVCGALSVLMKRLERFIQPRGRPLFSKSWFRRLNGLVVAVHALLLSLPLPIPFSNFFPSVVLLIISIGTLEEDALAIFVGYFAVLMNAVYFSALVLLPYLGFEILNS